MAEFHYPIGALVLEYEDRGRVSLIQLGITSDGEFPVRFSMRVSKSNTFVHWTKWHGDCTPFRTRESQGFKVRFHYRADEEQLVNYQFHQSGNEFRCDLRTNWKGGLYRRDITMRYLRWAIPSEMRWRLPPLQDDPTATPMAPQAVSAWDLL